MSSKFKNTIGSTFLLYLPLLLLFVSVFNEFDFNYLNYQYFSFNFPFILIFYWSLKRIETLGYGFIFIAGMFNDAVLGFPIGISSLTYLIICGFAAYLRNITLRPSLIKDWFFFGFAILVVNSVGYVTMSLFFDGTHLNRSGPALDGDEKLEASSLCWKSLDLDALFTHLCKTR